MVVVQVVYGSVYVAGIHLAQQDVKLPPLYPSSAADICTSDVLYALLSLGSPGKVYMQKHSN